MNTHETRLLEESESGYRARDRAHFRELLRRLIVSRDERQSLVERGRAMAKKHDWNVLAGRYDDVLAAAAREP